MAFQSSSNDSNSPTYITNAENVTSDQSQQVFQYLLAPPNLSNSPTYSLWDTPIDGSVTRNFSYPGVGENSKASSQTSATQEESYAPTLCMDSMDIMENELAFERDQRAALQQRVERLEGMEVELADSRKRGETLKQRVKIIEDAMKSLVETAFKMHIGRDKVVVSLAECYDSLLRDKRTLGVSL